jgi:16S rRNA A1518/A1519 N6-dimethyltransferase RsmA/KsgA/DIM1 with predicted DNA glycosylase/AP lyase activity
MGDFSRNLDQSGKHYMIDKKLIDFIVNNAGLKSSDIVLEIGYGKGALTKELAKRCKVIAVDIEENKFDSKNIVFVHGNILELFDELYKKHKFNKIVSNIPYNISEPLMRLLFKHQELESIVLTVGKNFADILSKKDNRIGIIVNHLYDIEQLKLVNPKSFFPSPRVDSIYRKLVLLDDVKLKNALEKILKDKTKNEVRALTDKPLFNKRLYELSNEEFIEFNSILQGI